MLNKPQIVQAVLACFLLIFGLLLWVEFRNYKYREYPPPPSDIHFISLRDSAAIVEIKKQIISGEIRAAVLSTENLEKKDSLLFESAGYYSRLYEISRNQNFLDSALIRYSRFITSAATHDKKHLMPYVSALSLREKYQQAADLLGEFLSGNPRDADVLHELIMTYFYRLNEPDSAGKYLEKMIILEPWHPVYHFMYGALIEQNGNIDSALACYKTEVKLPPDSSGNSFRFEQKIISKVFSSSLEEVLKYYKRKQPNPDSLAAYEKIMRYEE